MHPIVEKYIPCVEFIAQISGPHCEVLLHDLTDMEHSIVAVSRNSLTGRKTGGPITEFALSILKNPEYRACDYVVNYTGKAMKPDQVFRSSTLFIRDDDRNIVGMLCVNIDVSGLLRAGQVLQDFALLDPGHLSLPEEEQPHPRERFLPCAEDLLEDMLQSTCRMFAVSPRRMNVAERKQLVAMLSEQGYFFLKGGVKAAADCMGISEQTVYRYIKEKENDTPRD